MRIVLLGIVLACAAGAQTLGEPFFLLRITQSDGAAIQPYRDMKVETDVVGIQSLTGPNQTWFLEPHPSFAVLETIDQALASARQVDGTRLIGLYRAGLSYRPDEAIKLMRTSRYFQVTVYRIRPGADIDFAELIRIRKTTFDSINLDRPELGYQIISGAVSGTYIFLAPLQSLRTLDNSFARMSSNPEGFAQARSKETRQIQWEADITREHMLFRVSPEISHVTAPFASSDAEFWRGR